MYRPLRNGLEPLTEAKTVLRFVFSSDALSILRQIPTNDYTNSVAELVGGAWETGPRKRGGVIVSPNLHLRKAQTPR